MNPKAVGERSEGQVLAAFLKAGMTVLAPFGDNQRYDMVIDHDGRFIRIQCKTARIRNEQLVFDTCSNNWNTKLKKDYKGQVDLFAAYSPQLDKVYIVPVSDVGTTGATLRLVPVKNGQKRGIRFAADHEFLGSVMQWLL